MRQLEAKKVELQRRVENLASEASARVTKVGEVNWRDDETLRESLLRTVRRIVVDCKGRQFRAEFLDGRSYEFRQATTSEGVEVFYTVPKGEFREFVQQAKEGMRGIEARYAARFAAKARKTESKAKA